MSIDIPQELEPFVRDVVSRGNCASAEEVVAEALRLYREIDRRRAQLQADITAGVESETVSGDVVFEELGRLVQNLDADAR